MFAAWAHGYVFINLQQAAATTLRALIRLEFSQAFFPAICANTVLAILTA